MRIDVLGVGFDNLTMDEAVARIQQESRRYAKRQLTWFRRNPAIHWIRQPAEPVFSDTLRDALTYLADCGFRTAEPSP